MLKMCDREKMFRLPQQQYFKILAVKELAIQRRKRERRGETWRNYASELL